MRQQRSVFFFFQACLPLTSRSACQTYGPVDGLLGAAGDRCVDWWWQRWLTTAVWTPVSTYWPNSLKTRLMSPETQKANPTCEVDSRLLLFTSHWAPSLICAGTDLKAPSPFDLSYLRKAVRECDTNVNKSISPVAINSTGFLFFLVTKVPVCFAEVRISSINPAFVVQEEHLELLSQTLGSYAVVS